MPKIFLERTIACLMGLAVCPGAATPARAEACFRSAREAAASAGVRDGQGFRLEGVRVDRLGGARWATVRSCQHPEQPGTLVRLQNTDTPAAVVALSAPPAAPAGQPSAPPLVRAGQVVRVMRFDGASRFEIAGVAQNNAALGGTVRVRLATVGDTALATVAAGIARGGDVVELEAGR